MRQAHLLHLISSEQRQGSHVQAVHVLRLRGFPLEPLVSSHSPETRRTEIKTQRPDPKRTESPLRAAKSDAATTVNTQLSPTSL